MGEARHGLIDNWLRTLKDTQQYFWRQLAPLDDEARFDRLVELNVIEQVYNLGKTSIVQAAWQTRPQARSSTAGCSTCAAACIHPQTRDDQQRRGDAPRSASSTAPAPDAGTEAPMDDRPRQLRLRRRRCSAPATMGFAIQRGATCTVAAVDEVVQRTQLSPPRRPARGLAVGRRRAARRPGAAGAAEDAGRLRGQRRGRCSAARCSASAPMSTAPACSARSPASARASGPTSSRRSASTSAASASATCSAPPAPRTLADGSPVLQASAWVALLFVGAAPCGGSADRCSPVRAPDGWARRSPPASGRRTPPPR